MKRNVILRTAAVTAALVCAAVAPPRGAGLDLGITGRTNANPSAAASGRFVAVAWGAATKDGATDVYVAVSRDEGTTFSAPLRINDAGSRASLSGEQPPRVALVPRGALDPGLVVVWTAKGTTGTRLLSARSNDGGKTFAARTVVPGTDAAGNRGWETIATDRDGRVIAVWLDHRELAADSASAAHAPHVMHQHAEQHTPGQHTAQSDGAVRSQLSKLFFARLDDRPGARPVTGGVCYCCKTALVTGSDGSIYAAWRHVYSGNRRDIAFAMSRDGGRTFSGPLRISEDDWQLDGCPENGPALAVDAANHIHVVWPTLINESGQETLALFYAMSRDGRAFGRRLRIGSAGPAYHPQLTVTGTGELLVAWDELVSGKRRVRVGRGTPGPDGSIAFGPLTLPAPAGGSYPALASTASGTVIAWTTAGPGSRIAVARLPAGAQR